MPWHEDFIKHQGCGFHQASRMWGNMDIVALAAAEMLAQLNWIVSTISYSYILKQSNMVESRVQIDWFTMTLAGTSLPGPRSRTRGEYRRCARQTVQHSRCHTCTSWGSSQRWLFGSLLDQGERPFPTTMGGGSCQPHSACRGHQTPTHLHECWWQERSTHFCAAVAHEPGRGQLMHVGADKQGRQVGMCTFKNWQMDAARQGVSSSHV